MTKKQEQKAKSLGLSDEQIEKLQKLAWEVAKIQVNNEFKDKKVNSN